jgi:hypothetical protein
MFKKDSVIIQPDDNVYYHLARCNTKCEGKVLPSQVITFMFTSTQMITPNVQAYAIFRLDDNILLLDWSYDRARIILNVSSDWGETPLILSSGWRIKLIKSSG